MSRIDLLLIKGLYFLPDQLQNIAQSSSSLQVIQQKQKLKNYVFLTNAVDRIRRMQEMKIWIVFIVVYKNKLFG